ncbi:fatty acid desaturase family protein [Clostridium sp. 'White wine YQ']|uniref:fatty acid desaturase family protein n=1 Tax=Clostridium sp. 'White wine YQ' TaxID=3027474 RepID=UPI0023655822|nr:acyl-CoA desaturase [Clostridium sp. 'White wine YQ']MDD7795291.1 acyl-CoA desaturase [Clostridium sp. 'White wine YQ']
MNNLHNISWYASKIIPELPKKVFKTVPTRLLGGLAYAVVIITGILLIVLTKMNLISNFMISIILGFSFAAMGFLGHEILHGSVVKTVWLKNFLGAIAFFPLSVGPKLWVKWHNMNHHAYTQNEEKDPDAWMSLEKYLKRPFIILIYKIPLQLRSLFSFISLSITFTIHSTRMFVEYIIDIKEKGKLTLWVQFIVPWTVWIGLLFYVGVTKWTFIYLLPAMIGNFIVMAYISTNHRLNPLVDINDPLINSLSVRVPKWIDILHFNFSYHTEHHLFPRMNPKYYPLIKQHILKHWPERYNEMSLSSALISLWKTPRIYYKEVNLIDPEKGKIYNTLYKDLK